MALFSASRTRRYSKVKKIYYLYISSSPGLSLVLYPDSYRWLKEEYNDPEVIITENGWSDEGELDDVGRVEYLRAHMAEVLRVVSNNECNVKGYTGTLRRVESP